MRSQDIAAVLKPFLVSVPGYPHVRAMRTPPCPRSLPAATGTPTLRQRANDVLMHLSGVMSRNTGKELLTRTLARREAVQSSQIEGTRSNLSELLTYEATQSADGMPADVTVTQRYVEALQLGLDAVRQQGRSALSLELVHRMHACLLQDEAIPAGVYRDLQVWIGGHRIEDADFIPAPPADIEAAMEDLERNALQYLPREDEQTSLSVLAQMAIAHAQFETIHPYRDGNGRTGRILMPLILASEGLPPLYLSGHLMRHRQRYYAALRRVQLHADWGPWLDMVASAVLEEAAEVQSLDEALATLVLSWEPLLSNFRSHSVARRLPALLVEHPVVSAHQVSQWLGVSTRAALTGIQALQGIGILSQPDSRKWRRTFHASAILDLLNNPPNPAKLPLKGAHRAG